MLYVILLFTLLSSEARKSNASFRYAISKRGSSTIVFLLSCDAKIQICIELYVNRDENSGSFHCVRDGGGRNLTNRCVVEIFLFGLVFATY